MAALRGPIAETMEAFFDGPRLRFSFNSTVTSSTHDFDRPSALVAEIADARVYGGMHFRNSVHHGAALGRAVAHYISEHALLPNYRHNH